tara:strand:- start:1441 stop:1626 length:186 start_codon:yes stop_codon:yes gene_type:complete
MRHSPGTLSGFFWAGGIYLAFCLLALASADCVLMFTLVNEGVSSTEHKKKAPNWLQLNAFS